MQIIKNIRPEITPNKVVRLLGKRKSKPSRRTRKKIESCIQRSYEIIEPKVLYTEKEISAAGGGMLRLEDDVTLKSGRLSRTLNPCDRVNVFLATIGGEMDEAINSLLEENRAADAYIMDAIGSVAVEETVEKFQSIVDSRMQENDEATTLRFSPGYCDWKVQEQKKIFELLDNSAIDVELTDSCLMNPRKSVSGVFGIGNSNDIDGKSSNPCLLCNLTRCIARRV